MDPNVVTFENILLSIIQSKGWQASKDAVGTISIVVPTKLGRTQDVYVTYARDSDQATIAFFWSICADVNLIRDPLATLRANYSLCYGAYAIKEQYLIIQEGVLIEGADLPTVTKIVWQLAKTADGYEEALYGANQRF